jgi:hypothetical protein
MDLIKTVFNRANIYEMLFVSIDSVLEYPTLEALEIGNKGMYDQWIQIRSGYRDEYSFPYETSAVKYPEFCKIVAISYGTIGMVNGEPKMNFKKIAGSGEDLIIETFLTYLNELDKSPILCGFSLSKHKIPLLIKRYLVNKGTFSKPVKLPVVIKEMLSSKPLEGDLVVDVEEVWKFGGTATSTVSVISEFLGLKNTVEIYDDQDLSKHFWGGIKDASEETIKWIATQSITKVNVAMRIMNELSQL